MTTDIVKVENTTVDILQELQQTEQVVTALMKSKHYAKMGSEGIYAIIQKAKSMGINPMDALNGGVYYVQGKVEMSAQMMNRLIRSKGHSIQKDPKSTKDNCILHGRRVDNGDKWSVSFGLDDARKAGLVKPNGPWEKYPDAMCFARALSLLARQLFSDVIVDCYVEGEISLAPPLHAPIDIPCVDYINQAQVILMNELLKKDEEYPDTVKKLLLKAKCDSIESITSDKFDSAIKWIKDRLERQQQAKEIVKPEVIEIETIPEAEDESMIFTM